MGRHSGIETQLRRATAPTAPLRKRSKGRVVLSVLAMAACAGIALVTVTDPYAGATAAAFYQEPVLVHDSGEQRYPVQGGYVLVSVDRDHFTAVSVSTSGNDLDGDLSSSAQGSYVTPVGVAQTYAAKLVASKGWAPSEFGCLVSLWNRESGWNTHAANPSGAYGIPQSLPGSKMATAGGDWQNSYQTQITWGLGYISGSYGSPCGAWAHSNAVGWY